MLKKWILYIKSCVNAKKLNYFKKGDSDETDRNEKTKYANSL